MAPAGSGLSGLSGLAGLVGAGALRLTAPTLAQMGAAPTKRGDADMLDWACSRPWQVDQFGQALLFVQQVVSGTKYHVPVTSSDGGATWSVPTLSGAGWSGDNTLGDQAIVRLAHCFDPVHDQVHTCVVFDQTDGVYLRTWSIARDGSNHVTGLARLRQMQLEVGVGSMTHDTPQCLWLSDLGALHVSWTAINTGHTGGKAEGRGTYKVMAGTSADHTQANWLAPMNEAAGAGATDSIGSTVPVKYSCYVKSSVSSPIFLALGRLANKDFAFFAAMGGGGGTGGGGSVYYNRVQWAAGSSDWRTGLVAALAADAGKLTISAFNFSGQGGYNLKHQLMSKLVQAGAGVVGVAFPRWDGVKGDTVVIATVDPASEAGATIVDAYAAGGAHSYAPTCDLAWHAGAQRFVPTYIKTTTQSSYFKTLTAALAVDQPETLLHSASVDIPYVAEDAATFYDRDTTARTLPDKFYAYAGRGSWS
jgi:hypothetical protein